MSLLGKTTVVEVVKTFAYRAAFSGGIIRSESPHKSKVGAVMFFNLATGSVLIVWLARSMIACRTPGALRKS